MLEIINTMKENILKHWKTTITGIVTLLVYWLSVKGYIEPPFNEMLKEQLPLISMAIASIVLTFYAKDKSSNDGKKEE